MCFSFCAGGAERAVRTHIDYLNGTPVVRESNLTLRLVKRCCRSWVRRGGALQQ